MSKKSNSKNILYVEGNIDGTIGGSYYSLFYLVDGIDKKRYTPIVIFYHDHDLIPVYQQAGIETRVFELPKPIHLLSPSRRVNSLFSPVVIIQKILNFLRFFVGQGFRYAIYLRRNNIDLVHLNNSIVRNHSWMLGAAIARVKCITHERGINAKYPHIARFFAKRLDAIICISEAVKDNMMKKGFKPSNLIVIHNGLDPDRIQIKMSAKEIRDKYDIDEHDPVIGIIGNVKQWKGQEVVIKAIASVHEKFPDIKCFIVGDTAIADSNYKDRLIELVEQTRMQNNIIFTGYQSNVADYINVMDIVIHASIDPEPFGRVLIEAMALAKPVIGSRGGAVTEIVEDKVTGLHFAPGDNNDLAQGILTLLNDHALRDSMGRCGLERLKQEFHVKKNIEKTSLLYENIFS